METDGFRVGLFFLNTNKIMNAPTKRLMLPLKLSIALFSMALLFACCKSNSENQNNNTGTGSTEESIEKELNNIMGKNTAVGLAVVAVKDGKIIASAHNLRETGKNVLYHAELLAIDSACKALGGWRLHQCDMYVTLEPCPMCMGASLNARVDKLYFGAYEQKGRSLTQELADANLLNHKTQVVGGVLEEECSSLMKNFFKELREKKRQ